MSARLGAHRCRQCHASAHSGSGSSKKGKECGASLLSLARLCSREMVVVAVAQVVVDVCRPCELASLTGGSSRRCVTSTPRSLAPRVPPVTSVARAALVLAGGALGYLRPLRAREHEPAALALPHATGLGPGLRRSPPLGISGRSAALGSSAETLIPQVTARALQGRGG
jgi:hypothetical protein